MARSIFQFESLEDLNTFATSLDKNQTTINETRSLNPNDQALQMSLDRLQKTVDAQRAALEDMKENLAPRN